MSTVEVTGPSISKVSPANLMPVTESIRACGAAMLRMWKWLTQQGSAVLVRGANRRLKVAETVSLGEKRFVSILQVDGEQFLLGASSSSIVLLARLEAKPKGDETESFEALFSQAESAARDNEAGHNNLAEVTR